MPEDILQTIRKAWGWIGIQPFELIDTNAFGNVICKDMYGHFWRIYPEDLLCEVIAESDLEFEKLRLSCDFKTDWNMSSLVMEAEIALGKLHHGQRYCLKMPSVLGGAYASENIGVIQFSELISASGDMAERIKELPDGAQVQIHITD